MNILFGQCLDDILAGLRFQLSFQQVLAAGEIWLEGWERVDLLAPLLCLTKLLVINRFLAFQ